MEYKKFNKNGEYRIFKIKMENNIKNVWIVSVYE